MSRALRSPDEAAGPDGEVLSWFVRRQGHDWTTNDERDFQAWLAADPARRDRHARWEAHWRALDGLPAEAVDALRGRLAIDKARETARAAGAARPPSRRAAFTAAAGLAVVAMAGGGGLMAWQQWQAQPLFVQAYATQRGEQARVELPDGSQLWLDTATRLDVRYDRERREVALQEGQALFSVRADPARPFRVAAGPVDVTVVGTRFAVRHTPGIPGARGVRVSVEEGQVRSTLRHARGGPGSGGVLLAAGEQVVADEQGVLSPVATVSRGEVAPWREQRVSFVDMPLDQALAELERYGPTGLVVRDPAVAGLRLSGTFNPLDVATLRRVLPTALPVRLRTLGDTTELVSAR